MVRAFPRGYMDPYLKLPLHMLFVLPPTIIKRAWNYLTGQDSTVIGAVRDPDQLGDEEREGEGEQEQEQKRAAQLEMEPARALLLHLQHQRHPRVRPRL